MQTTVTLWMYLYESSDRAGDPVAEPSLQEVSGQYAGEDGGQCVCTREMNCKHCEMPLKETRGDVSLCHIFIIKQFSGAF